MHEYIYVKSRQLTHSYNLSRFVYIYIIIQSRIIHKVLCKFIHTRRAKIFHANLDTLHT